MLSSCVKCLNKRSESLRNGAKCSGSIYIELCSMEHEKYVKVSKQHLIAEMMSRCKFYEISSQYVV